MSDHLDNLIVIKYLGTYFYASPDIDKKFYTIESTVPTVPLLKTENVPFEKIHEAVQKQCLLHKASYRSSLAKNTVAQLEEQYPFKKYAEISTARKDLEQALLDQLNFGNEN